MALDTRTRSWAQLAQMWLRRTCGVRSRLWLVEDTWMLGVASEQFTDERYMDVPIFRDPGGEGE